MDRFWDDTILSLLNVHDHPWWNRKQKSLLTKLRLISTDALFSLLFSRFPQQISVLPYSCVNLTLAFSEMNRPQSFLYNSYMKQIWQLSDPIGTHLHKLGIILPLHTQKSSGRGTNRPIRALSEETISSISFSLLSYIHLNILTSTKSILPLKLNEEKPYSHLLVHTLYTYGNIYVLAEISLYPLPEYFIAHGNYTYHL